MIREASGYCSLGWGEDGEGGPTVPSPSNGCICEGLREVLGAMAGRVSSEMDKRCVTCGRAKLLDGASEGFFSKAAAHGPPLGPLELEPSLAPVRAALAVDGAEALSHANWDLWRSVLSSKH